MPWQKADGTIIERIYPRVGWGEHPKYKLNDCKCGGSQNKKEVYTLYVGAGSKGSWNVRCKKCGAVIADINEAVAVQKWNSGEDISGFYT